MTDTTTAAPPTAFCQNCGTPLTPSTTRTVGPATYCEPCLDLRLHGAPRSSGIPYQPAPFPAGPMGPSAPNPGLAALLGLIPGVGAMYNGQYAKGIVHLIVFAVLIALTDTIGLFGLFIAGWEFYMVIEAHHTARARRDHTPLPNPFNLNDIGERLGFGKAWTAGAPNVTSVFHDAANAAASAAQQFHAQTSGQTSRPPAAPWPYPPTATPPHPGPNPQPDPQPNPQPDPQPAYATPPAASFGDWPHQHQYQQNATAGTQQPWRDTFAAAPPPPGAQTPYTAAPMPPITGHHRFPAGAVWLIGAGIFFLLSTTGLFHIFRGEIMVGFGLIGLSVWLFLRRMLESGLPLNGPAALSSSYRTLRCLRGPAWVGLTGVLFLLNAFHILRWNHSWPLYIILAGVMGFLERAAQHQALYQSPPGPSL